MPVVNLSSDAHLRNSSTLRFVNEGELGPEICVVHVNDIGVRTILIHLRSLQPIPLNHSSRENTQF